MAMDPASWRDRTQYNPLADKEGFAVVYPQGYTPATPIHGVVPNLPSWLETPVGYTWNAGTCCPGATTEKVDDVQFTKDLLAYLKVAIPKLSKHKLNVDSS